MVLPLPSISTKASQGSTRDEISPATSRCVQIFAGDLANRPLEQWRHRLWRGRLCRHRHCRWQCRSQRFAAVLSLSSRTFTRGSYLRRADEIRSEMYTRGYCSAQTTFEARNGWHGWPVRALHSVPRHMNLNKYPIARGLSLQQKTMTTFPIIFRG